ncbi:MAG TPA: NepR family anti-sigma factor [Microvirga sp.]|jgi:hypothetical protein|nr:NepR family anti-sigma factor [Microvirga sp.]
MTAPLPKDAALEEEGADQAPEPALDAQVQQQLGSLLRGMYADLLNRPVPDRFLEILQRLDERPEDDRP